MEPIEPKPRYRWQKTWPDAVDDFTGWEGDVRFARMYSHTNGEWRWFGQHRGDLSTQGSEDTARLAAVAAEEWWDKVEGQATI